MKKKSNILFFLSDDQGPWTLGCDGNSEIKTPNLNQLYREGILCDHFFCTSPVCSPARASILTGKMPSQHGVHDWIKRGCIAIDDCSDETKKLMDTHRNDPRLGWSLGVAAGEYKDRGIEYLEGHVKFTDILSQQGYRCGISGKWHLGESTKKQGGYDYFNTLAFGGGDYYHQLVINGEGQAAFHDGYITDYVTDNGIAFLDEMKDQDQPFFLSIHYTAPHAPWGPEQHPKAYLDLYKDCPFHSVPAYVEPHPDATLKLQGTGEEMKAKHHEILRGYYASITAMDANIGRVMDYLKEQGMWEDTIIIFSSDNGMSMGHHGIIGKGNGTYPQNMYDTAVKVPFIIGGNPIPANGMRYSGMLSQYDIMPTLLDYLNMDMPEGNYPGTSFASLMKGEEPKGREDVIIYDEYGPVRMIRTKAYKYIHRYPDGPHEFYDLQKDPEELCNAYGKEAYGEIIEDLRSRLGSWFDHYVDPRIDGRYEAVSGAGQLERAGELAENMPNYQQR